MLNYSDSCLSECHFQCSPDRKAVSLSVFNISVRPMKDDIMFLVKQVFRKLVRFFIIFNILRK